jgi:hypothetical protein
VEHRHPHRQQEVDDLALFGRAVVEQFVDDRAAMGQRERRQQRL